MNIREKSMNNLESGVLSLPNAVLEAAGIPIDCDLTVETLPGVILIAQSAPLEKANQPYVRLFSDLGIEPKEVTAILKKGGYFHE